MKKLFIVESPGKAKTIKKYLGEDFIVTSTMGHIRDLPQKKIGIEINPPNLMIEYETMTGKEKTIKELKKYISQSNEIYLAPDADREGEIIAFHINEIIESDKKNTKKKVYRVTYNEISKKAILESIKNKRDLDQNMIGAQQARRILDRLVGYKISPILWRKISKGLSAGRVQSVALKLICMREEEINKFIIEEYWTIHGSLVYEKSNISAEITLKEDPKKKLSAEESKKIISKTNKNNWLVEEIKEKEKLRKPYAPFTTSSLQQSAYNILHYNAQQTMIVAQQLYEGISLDNDNSLALITYMRTDSTRISQEALESSKEYIIKNFGSKYAPKKSPVYEQKNKTQDAHEAIRPIDISITPQSIKPKLTKEQYALYSLIWNRFLACQMSEAIYVTRNILLIDESKELIGKITGSHITFDGFLKVYNNDEEENENNNKLPPEIKKNTLIHFDLILSKQHFTQPPSRYNEATLIKELEQKGIGRPSTYVPILRTIRDRLYTELDEKKRFIPTSLGKQIYVLLEENITKIMDLSFTADMEKKLDQVAQGEITRNSIIFDFYDYLIPTIKIFLEKKIDKQYENTLIACKESNCSGKLLVKWSKNGEFLGCSNFPTCKYTANFSRNENKEILLEEKKNKEIGELLEIKCIKCDRPMLKKTGKYGTFTACSGYPECNYIKTENTISPCPECKKYPLNKKTWKGKIFWGCGNYPHCKFTINGDIIEKKCNKCEYNFFKKIIDEDTCANKTCSNNQ